MSVNHQTFERKLRRQKRHACLSDGKNKTQQKRQRASFCWFEMSRSARTSLFKNQFAFRSNRDNNDTQTVHESFLSVGTILIRLSLAPLLFRAIRADPLTVRRCAKKKDIGKSESFFFLLYLTIVLKSSKMTP